MKIYDMTKTYELDKCDLSLGYLQSDILETPIPEVTEIPEQFHYIITKSYPNGGKEVQKVIDVKGRSYAPAYTKTEEIQVYIPYTENELIYRNAEQEITELKQFLFATDYQAIKYAEGVLSEEDYAAMKQQRQEWRQRINELELIINNII